MDFFNIEVERQKNGTYVISPSFLVQTSKDLMIRGNKFYAIWDEEKGLWSTKKNDAVRLIDAELKTFADDFLEKNKLLTANDISVKYLKLYKTHKAKEFDEYIKTAEDNFKQLDNKIVFANQTCEKKDYISHKLDYALEQGDTSAWDTLVDRLYSPSEKEKIEWAIGSLVSGDSKKIQKFFLFYGDPGTGKSTILNIIQAMFKDYWAVIDAKSVTSTAKDFALTCLRTNPMLLVQHDCDLSKIEDNSRLNSLVSHEVLLVNEKFLPEYPTRPQALILLGTNMPVKITNGKSGVIRRLVDIIPTGDLFGKKEYDNLMNNIEYEYGAIAYKCLQVYQEKGKSYYNNYKPLEMMYRTDPFFNFVEYYSDVFSAQDGTNLTQAYEMYKTYILESGSNFKRSRPEVRDSLKDYFKVYKEVMTLEDGSKVRYYYSGFKNDRFVQKELIKKDKESEGWLHFDEMQSRFDKEMEEAPAQYATEEGNPKVKWVNCKTLLKDLDTTKLHWVRVPEHHIVIDFDIQENGKKSYAKNLEAALKWLPTYAELSKSGQGIHLHYIYKGDPTELSRIYADNVEIKVFTGNASLRRKLTRCNDLPIATISSGLPLREGGKKVVDAQQLKDEKQLRALIKGNLQKKYLPATKPSMDFINKLCTDAYNSGMHYDISDMAPSIMAFAANSSNNSSYCLDIFAKLKLKSEDETQNVEQFLFDKIVFFDCEVFPNLFLVNWKFQGKDQPIHRMINPTPEEIAELIKYKLVGFNCRRYDNHILYGRLIGESNLQLFTRSQRIISGSNNGFFGEAYNLSYTDIYDFSSKKQSLKKFEIELKLHHQELGFKWDEPVPEEKWQMVSEYCDNDVISTEAVWDDRQADFIARQILADIAGMTVNDTTNQLTTRIIFGKDRNPQSEFNYRNMAEIPFGYTEPDILPDDIADDLSYPEYTVFYGGCPVFPGYEYSNGQSSYRGELFGEGGYVYAEPGIWIKLLTDDIASMHPHSMLAEELFGPVYTERLRQLVQARINIKHGDYEACRDLLDGKLMPYLTDKSQAKALSGALKIAINSIYGLTAAKFANAFRDPRNVDNIVAKRGELFMINLKNEVQAKGYRVVHIKTDSIKIAQPDDYILNFIVKYGKLYGYTFEVENKFDKVALVNDAVYIAKRAIDDPEWLDECEKAAKKHEPEPTRWTATGAQFSVPYVFKSLFSHEAIELDDMCETKSCSTSLYLDFNEDLPEGEHKMIFVGKVGQFCPIKQGSGGGLLLREQGDKFNAVTGTKGYRWKESEVVRTLQLEDQIDRDYYRGLCDDAIKTIEKFGSFEEFAA